jgi:hypothetical protein
MAAPAGKTAGSGAGFRLRAQHDKRRRGENRQMYGFGLARSPERERPLRCPAPCLPCLLLSPTALCPGLARSQCSGAAGHHLPSDRLLSDRKWRPGERTELVTRPHPQEGEHRGPIQFDTSKIRTILPRTQGATLEAFKPRSSWSRALLLGVLARARRLVSPLRRVHIGDMPRRARCMTPQRRRRRNCF